VQLELAEQIVRRRQERLDLQAAVVDVGLVEDVGNARRARLHMHLVPALVALARMQPVERLGHDAALLRREYALLDEEPVLVERSPLRLAHLPPRDPDLPERLLGVHWLAPPSAGYIAFMPAEHQGDGLGRKKKARPSTR
jgi:hypothetical protein